MIDPPAPDWASWFRLNLQTLGVSLGFAFAGSSMLLWITSDKTPLTASRAVLVIVAGQLVGTIATAGAFGYMQWNIFLAPIIGLVCGIVALPLIRAIAKSGQRVEDRADDLTDGFADRWSPRSRDDKK